MLLLLQVLVLLLSHCIELGRLLRMLLAGKLATGKAGCGS